MTSNLREPSRDFIGYADNPPQADWPGGARIAVNFCINYEEGGERSVAEGDPHNETRISDVAVPARPGERDPNIESSYEYGSRVGYWRILKAFTDRDLPATVNLVGRAGELNPRALQAMIAAGFDLHPHGWRWIDYAALGIDEERACIAKSIAQIESLTGTRPLGYYAGLPSVYTQALSAEYGFLYCSDVYNDDLPYWSPDFPGLLLVPYSMDTNDSRFQRDGGGYVLGQEFVTYVCDTFDQLYAEGADTPQMMTIGLHARLIGRPGRIGSLHRILDHMRAHGDVWFCRRDDLARHWRDRHPDPRLTDRLHVRE